MRHSAYLTHTFVAVAIAAAVVPAHALDGRVVAVLDGDTITVLDADHLQHRIRIAAIDAPEKRQPFGNAAKESLSRLAYGRQAVARCKKQRDRYEREVCAVFVENRDVGLEQIRSGLAWWYRDYAREQPVDERASYESAEAAAKDAHRGLWREEHPTPPWVWRKQMRSGQAAPT